MHAFILLNSCSQRQSFTRKLTFLINVIILKLKPRSSILIHPSSIHRIPIDQSFKLINQSPKPIILQSPSLHTFIHSYGGCQSISEFMLFGESYLVRTQLPSFFSITSLPVKGWSSNLWRHSWSRSLGTNPLCEWFESTTRLGSMLPSLSSTS